MVASWSLNRFKPTLLLRGDLTLNSVEDNHFQMCPIYDVLPDVFVSCGDSDVFYMVIPRCFNMHTGEKIQFKLASQQSSASVLLQSCPVTLQFKKGVETYLISQIVPPRPLASPCLTNIIYVELI